MPVSDVNQNKFLVTWIDTHGNTRGQATKLKADAERMFKFVVEQGAKYAEVRKLGRITDEYRSPEIELAPEAAETDLPDTAIAEALKRLN